MSRRPRTFQNNQNLQRISYEEFLKLDHTSISDSSVLPSNHSETVEGHANNVQPVLDIAPQPKDNKPLVIKPNPLSEKKKKIQGYSYIKLVPHCNYLSEDRYELREEDIQFLQRFNEMRSVKAMAMQQDNDFNGIKMQLSNGMIKSINEDIFKSIIVHFEMKSTRQTTATKEEVLIEIPKDIKEVLEQDEFDQFFQYWKNERENDRYLRQGETSSQKEVFPFIRRFWRASCEEPAQHQVFRAAKELNRKRTRKSSRPDIKEAQEKKEILETDLNKCKELALKIRQRELLKRELAYQSIVDFNSSIPGLKEEFQIANSFISREKELSSLLQVYSKDPKKAASKQANMKATKKSQNNKDYPQLQQEGIQDQELHDERFEETEVEKKNISDQQVLDGQAPPLPLQQILIKELVQVQKGVGQKQQNNHKDEGAISKPRSKKEANNLNKKNKLVSIPGVSQNEEIGEIKSEQDKDASDIKKEMNGESEKPNEKKKVVRQRNKINKEEINEKQEEEEQDQILKVDKQGESSSFLAAFLMHFSTFKLPITLENIQQSDAIQSTSKEMQEQEQQKLKNINIMAYILRKRLGRSGREYLDRVCEKPTEVGGIQSGKISYFIEPERQKVVFNTFHYQNPEAIRYFDKKQSINEHEEIESNHNTLKITKQIQNQIGSVTNEKEEQPSSQREVGVSLGDKIINEKYSHYSFLKNKREKLKGIIEQPFKQEIQQKNMKQNNYYQKLVNNLNKNGKWAELPEFIAPIPQESQEQQDNRKLKEIIEQGEYKKWKDAIIEQEGNHFKKCMVSLKKSIGEKIKERENERIEKMKKQKEIEEQQQLMQKVKTQVTQPQFQQIQSNQDPSFEIVNGNSFNHNQPYSEYHNSYQQQQHPSSFELQNPYIQQNHFSQQQPFYQMSNQSQQPPQLKSSNSYDQQVYFSENKQFLDGFNNEFENERMQSSSQYQNNYLNQNVSNYQNIPPNGLYDDDLPNCSPNILNSPSQIQISNYQSVFDGLNDARPLILQSSNEYYQGINDPINNYQLNNDGQDQNFVQSGEEQQLDYFTKEDIINHDQYFDDNIDHNQHQAHVEDF